MGIAKKTRKATLSERDENIWQLAINDKSSNVHHILDEEKNKTKKQLTKIELKLFEEIDELKTIKKELVKNTCIPTHYQNKHCILAFLGLIINKRADTLKEMINLYEEEEFRGSVIEYLQTINLSIKSLESSVK
ncbi:MAG: hypothetical protein MJ201_00960 [Mycoplasmoidaceae bacterium]|nr:hypothetical protein [Mycoplasmoidaceae bacterium]